MLLRNTPICKSKFSLLQNKEEENSFVLDVAEFLKLSAADVQSVYAVTGTAAMYSPSF